MAQPKTVTTIKRSKLALVIACVLLVIVGVLAIVNHNGKLVAEDNNAQLNMQLAELTAFKTTSEEASAAAQAELEAKTAEIETLTADAGIALWYLIHFACTVYNA